MRVASRLYIGCLLVLTHFVGRTTDAQQVIPRLVRQFSAVPGANFSASGLNHDTGGRLWIASTDGVTRFDGRQFRTFHDPVLKTEDNYYHVVPAPDGRVWLKMGRGYSLSYVDPNQERIVRLPDSTRLVRDYLARYGCHFLFADTNGILWIGLRNNGLLTFNPQTGAVAHVVDRPLDVRGITQDRRGIIYFTTTSQGLFAYTPGTGQLVNYRHNEADSTSLGNDATFGVLARPDGTVLVGVPEDVDVFTPATRTFRHLGLNQAPATNPQHRPHVVEFHNDAQGNTWFSTGIATYCYTSRNVLQWILLRSNPGEVDGLHVNPDNKLWVCAQGSLYEYDLTHLRPGPELIIQQVTINGNALIDNTDAQSLVYDSTGHPTLTVQENDPFIIRYALQTHKRAHNLRQRLNGYDRDWTIGDVYSGTANYQLPAGTYTFTVNGGRPTGGWKSTFSTVTIVIVPPIWKSNYAIAFALLLAGGASYFLIRTYRRRRKLQRELLREQLEAASLRSLDELKNQFFANVTHEFRTPLTLIRLATEQLADRLTGDWEKERLATIGHNSEHLSRLITEMLDIAKLDANKLPIQLKAGDPLLFVEQQLQAFTGLATQRRIDLAFITPEPLPAPASGDAAHDLYLFDDDKLGKIIYNLLSNALKFTPEGGRVTLFCRLTDNRQLVVSVQDTGIGIPANQLNSVFDRFYQADSSATRRYEGTGIGLAYVKELTELLGGRVMVESTPGRGSTFTVMMPMQVTTPNTAAEPVSASSLPPVPTIGPDNGGNDPPTDISERLLVLIVDDNEELRRYLASQLRPDYRVLEAVDGRDGIAQALATVPDLIVSDVMMPYVDGYELVRTLKNDERTSHIPILMLSAKSAFESKLHGLDQGADDYMGKPFSMAELNARVRNNLLTRQRWRQYLTVARSPKIDQRAGTNPVGMPLPDREKQFLARLQALILAHLTDEGVDVDWLVDHARMSRTQLHRKLTALTNLSTTGFIHSVRLGKAQELLQTGELTVAEVAYRVGYSSPAYFSKVFSEHFGYAPTKVSSHTSAL